MQQEGVEEKVIKEAQAPIVKVSQPEDSIPANDRNLAETENLETAKSVPSEQKQEASADQNTLSPLEQENWQLKG